MILTDSHKYILKYVLQNKKMIYVFLVTTLTITCIAILEPLIAKKIIDLTANINNLQEIISLSLFWLIIFFIKNQIIILFKQDLFGLVPLGLTASLPPPYNGGEGRIRTCVA